MVPTFTLEPMRLLAARAFLHWSQECLAHEADVDLSTISDFELGQKVLDEEDLAAIVSALESGGIKFTPDGGMVFSLSIYFMSEAKGAELHISYPEQGAFIVKDILEIFGEVHEDNASLEAVQWASPELKKKLIDLLKKHGKTVPQLKKLKIFIHSLRDNEYFLLLPEKAPSTAEKFELECYLRRLNNSDNSETDGSEVTTLFGKLLERYDITSPRTDHATTIGNTRRKDRRCRFCGLTIMDGATFDDEAHAIPRAFGNVHLLLGDECDACNHHFGKEIEPSLVAMLNIQRAFLGIQGRAKKGGRPELQFADGTIAHDGQKLNIKAQGVAKDGDTISVNLGEGQPMTPAAAYRALVKIVLSVVDSSHLPDLADTIEWVCNDKYTDRELPTVATAIINLPPNPSAQITVYCRKTPASRLPHLVGEFRLGCFMYVFVIPFSRRDTWNLVGFFDEDEFKDSFKHYAVQQVWAQQNLSSCKAVKLKPLIKFVQTPNVSRQDKV